jgi:anti-anti-sigma factor
MAIAKLTSGDSWEISISGRIDGAVAKELEVEILAASRAGAREIFVNLSRAEWICSAGIRVLLQYFQQMKGNGKKLLVARPSTEIISILEMTGFKSLIVDGDQAPD